MIDITKPLELEDGRWCKFHNMCRGEWFNVTIEGMGKMTRTFSMFTGHSMSKDIPSVGYTFPVLPNIRNKELTMIDTNKAVEVNGRDAKIVHIFDNGNLAVVIDGDTNVNTFDEYGQLISGTAGSRLTNKVQRRERYIAIYPDGQRPGGRAVTYTYSDSLPTRDYVKTVQNYNPAGFVVKQVLENDKVISTEIINA